MPGADSEPNNDNVNYVDVDTDNLDDFNALLNGKAQVKDAEPPEKVEKVVENVDSDEDDNDIDENADEQETETDDSPDGDDEDEEDEKPAKPAKKVNRFQERINELTAKAKEAERREADVLRRMDELAAKQNSAPTNDKPANSVEKDDSPSPDAKNEDGSEKYPLGEFDPNYIRDLTRHTIQKEQTLANERQAQERQQREFQEAREQLQGQWVEKLSAVTEQHEDFLDKTMQLETAFDGLDPNFSDYLVQTIKSLDHGPEVLYHFANNLAEAQKFVKLGPLAATLALGEINAKFKKESAPETKQPSKVTKAPPPAPTNKGNKTRTSVAADTDDLDEFSRMLFNKKR